MHRRKLWLFAGAVLAALALAGHRLGKSEWTGRRRAKSAGTLVFGAEQGGGPDWCCNLILGRGLQRVLERRVPDAGDPRRVHLHPEVHVRAGPDHHYKFQTNPQRITFYLRKNAKWSDGVP
jgi:hypothetical protein